MSAPKRADQAGIMPGLVLAAVGVLLTIVGRLLQVGDDNIAEVD